MLVGRDDELGRARQAVGLADGPGVAGLLLRGDAGIGKSRLVAELAHEAERVGRLVVAGHCVGLGGAARAWLPFVEVVAGLARVLPDVVAETQRRHPALGALTGEPTRDGGPADPGRIAEAVHALLVAAGTERPVLLVLEDVHWADDSSRDLLTLLLARGFDSPVSVVVTYRSDDLHRLHPLHDVLALWARLPLVARVDLAPLGPERMHELVRALDGAPATASALREVVERSDGNPFFAEELVASGGDGAATDDLSRLLRLRLDRLDEDGRLVVRAAALAGRDVRYDLLQAVVGLDDAGLDDALQQAVEHHILEAGADDTYSFRHALLGETLAEDLLPGARRRLHRAWLAALRAAPGASVPADISRHAAAVGDTETAAGAAVEAADAAMRVGGARDALRLYEAAMGWVGDHDPLRRAEIAMSAATAAEVGGEQVRSLDLLGEALEDLDPALHPVQRALALARVAAVNTVLDLPADPVAISREAMDLLPGDPDERGVTVMQHRLHVLIAHGLEREAARLADEITVVAERLALPAALAEVRVSRARLLATSDPAQAYADLTAALDHPDTGDETRQRILLRLGLLDREAGRAQRAYEHFVAGVAVADRLRRPWGPFGVECRYHAGRAAYELGRWDEAESLLSGVPELPQPARGFLESALVELHAARDGEVDPARLDETRDWWEVDGLLVVGCLGGMIDVLGRAGLVAQMLDWVCSGITTLDRIWGDSAQASIRISALLTGQAADRFGAAEPALRDRLVEACERLAAREAGRDPEDVPGPESRAWLVRLEAEGLRLSRARGAADAEAEVAAWERSVEAFDALPHVPEATRSRARLALALDAAGRTSEAGRVRADAMAVATRLGAAPLRALLDRAEPQAEAADVLLMPREHEILTHLALGRTNGQIATQLYISPKTVSVHVSNLLAKLGGSTRGEAVALARGRALLR